MKYPTRVSDAVHIMVFIYLNPTQDLSSVAIARRLAAAVFDHESGRHLQAAAGSLQIGYALDPVAGQETIPLQGEAKNEHQDKTGSH